MHEKYYNNKLYPLQDEVLDIIGKEHSSFYLSGGTALGRHYLHHRYSDDLDFFQNDSESFKNDANKIITALKRKYSVACNVTLLDEKFVRVFIKCEDFSLKLEMINDVPFRQGDIIAGDLFCRIDSWENILSNKISAISRNEPKDIADILFLAQKFSFNWKDATESAKKKDMWVNELEISSIFANYDTNLLKQLLWIEAPDYDKLMQQLKVISRRILTAENNSPI
jgi:hypothetical protein